MSGLLFSSPIFGGYTMKNSNGSNSLFALVLVASFGMSSLSAVGGLRNDRRPAVQIQREQEELSLKVAETQGRLSRQLKSHDRRLGVIERQIAEDRARLGVIDRTIANFEARLNTITGKLNKVTGWLKEHNKMVLFIASGGIVAGIVVYNVISGHTEVLATHAALIGDHSEELATHAKMLGQIPGMIATASNNVIDEINARPGLFGRLLSPLKVLWNK